MTFRTNASFKLLTIPEHGLASRAGQGKTVNLPEYVWYHIMAYLDLKFILSRLMRMNTKTRDIFSSLNSAMFDIFLRSYGLCSKIRRSKIPEKLDLIPFLTQLESNMAKAKHAKAQAESCYQAYIEKL